MRDSGPSGIEHQAGRRLGSDGLGGEMVPSAQGSTAAGFDHLSHRPIFSATLPSILGMLTMSCLCTLSYLFYIPFLGIWTFSSLISVLQLCSTVHIWTLTCLSIQRKDPASNADLAPTQYKKTGLISVHPWAKDTDNCIWSSYCRIYQHPSLWSMLVRLWDQKPPPWVESSLFHPMARRMGRVFLRFQKALAGKIWPG